MARLDPRQCALLPLPTLQWGEGRGEGPPQAPERDDAPHPCPSPVTYGERGPRGGFTRAIASWLRLLLFVTLTFAAGPGAMADPNFPPLTGRIVDKAALLT